MIGFKSLLLCIILLMTPVISLGQIEWMSMNEALAAQKVTPKKIFMDVYTDWCGPCKLLDRNTFTNKRLIRYMKKHYYAVKFDGEGTEAITYKDFTYTNPNHQPERKGRNSQHFFADALRINAYPSLVFFDETGELIQALPGYKTAQELELFLKLVASDDYKNVLTEEAWARYQDEFKSTF
jgi:thioredoxin-related protein